MMRPVTSAAYRRLPTSKPKRHWHVVAGKDGEAPLVDAMYPTGIMANAALYKVIEQVVALCKHPKYCYSGLAREGHVRFLAGHVCDYILRRQCNKEHRT